VGLKTPLFSWNKLMNNTEYTSLTAMITAIEAQINSLKTILASIAHQKSDKKPNVRANTESFDQDGHLMSDEEEKHFEVLMEKARKEELARMRSEAEKYYLEEMDVIAKEVTNEPG